MEEIIRSEEMQHEEVQQEEMQEERVEDCRVEEDEDLKNILCTVQEQSQLMQHLINNQIQIKDGLIDKLHNELAYYKNEESERYINHVLRRIIKIRDDMNKFMKSAEWTTMSVDGVKMQYQYIFEDITDLLGDENIEPFETREGEVFDASKHSVFKIEESKEALTDKTVKLSVREGYIRGDKVFKTEKVIINQYKGE